MTHRDTTSMTIDQAAEPVLLSEDALDQVSAGDLGGVMIHTMGTAIGGLMIVSGDLTTGKRLLTHQPQLLAKNVKELFK
ncbi:hypothetical protein MMB17_07600 [Methylobacterium organophilum]|uniref:hypothetical protein n=1 Tax=Methylobacterium organophilum TaxID=410 RepID=UPI001F135850|nr:hypothetical protein [Methylobacterium organophilum]UMY20291.1 hypothetical protein MMB17_07600 [Methylobacterium organophilum]